MNVIAPTLITLALFGLLQLVDLDRPGQFSWEAPGSFGIPSPVAHDDSFGVPSPGARDDIGLSYDMRGDAPALADPRQFLLVPPIPAIGECFTLTATGVLASTVCGTSAPLPGFTIDGNHLGAGGNGWGPVTGGGGGWGSPR